MMINNKKHENHYILGTKTLDYDSNIIEAASIEDFLIPMSDILKKEIQDSLEKLKHFSKSDQMVIEMNKLLEVAGILQSHFEFTLKVLESRSEEEVQSLKEKYHSINSYYQQVKTKEDLSIIPAKYVLLIFHDKLLYEFVKLMKQTLKKGWRGKNKLVKNYENLARVQILAKRFQVGTEHYGPVITFSKEDIFSLPKNDPIWQDLLKSADIKQILSKEAAYESFKEFECTNNLGHVIIQNINTHKSLMTVKGAYNIMKDLIYYGTHPRQSETHAFLRLANLKFEEAFDLWNLPDDPFLATMLNVTYSILDYDERIYVPRLFPAITKDVILKEYAEGTFNKLQPQEGKNIKAPELQGTREEIMEELFTESENKIPIRILSDEPLDLKESVGGVIKGVIRKATRVFTGAEICQPEDQKSDVDGTIIIHIHGGGFVAMSSAAHRVYLNRWVRNTKVIHFSIDYRLAPKDPYPAGLDDIWQGYLWIRNYAEKILGIKNQKVILVGDSAGGNLALALSLRLIRAGLEAPHACLLFYPALSVDKNTSSPSTFASIDDTMVSPAILKLCVKAYTGDEFKNLEDPFISPLAGSNELLEKLPPIRIVVGTKDPFHDDSWRLLAKMKKLNKDAKLIVHEHVRHGFLNHPGLKNYHLFMEEACDLIRELASIEKL